MNTVRTILSFTWSLLWYYALLYDISSIYSLIYRAMLITIQANPIIMSNLNSAA